MNAPALGAGNLLAGGAPALSGVGQSVSASTTGDHGNVAGSGLDASTVVDGVGVTREMNVQPVGEPSGPTQGSLLVGRTDDMGVLPAQLHDWLFVKSGNITSALMTTAMHTAPYAHWVQHDYVKKVLHGKMVANVELEAMITVSPTAFHMGSVVFSWVPFASQRPSLSDIDADWSFGRSRKHSVTVDLANPKVVVLRCPLIGPSGGVVGLPSSVASIELNTHRIITCAVGLNRVDGIFTDVPYTIQLRAVPGSCTYGLTAADFVSASHERPWSGALGALAGAAGHLSRVPVLSGVMLPTQRFLKMGASAAKAAGFSDPLDPQPPSHVVVSTQGRATNADLPVRGINLSTLSTTQRAVAAPFTDGMEDETSFAVVASRPGLVARMTFSALMAAGAPLIDSNTGTGAVVVDPLWRASPSTSHYVVPSGPAWLALGHAFWTGGLKYRVTPITSKYHSGRVRIIYEPNPFADAAVVPTRTDAAYTYSEVLDISEGAALEFVVPWTCQPAWNPTLSGLTKWAPSGTNKYQTGVANTNTRMHHNGLVYFLVESPLTSAFGAVIPDVTLMVEVMGGPGFDVMLCNLSNVQPLKGTGNKTILVSAVVGSDSFVKSRVLGSGVPHTNKLELYGASGVSSLRTLCKETVCVGPLARDVAPAPPSTANLFNQALSCTLWPRFYHGPRQLWSPAEFWGSGYGVVSGSAVYKVTMGMTFGTSSTTTDATVAGNVSPSATTYPHLAGVSLLAPGYQWASGASGYTGVVPDGWASSPTAVAAAAAKVKFAMHGVHVQELTQGPLEFVVPHTGAGVGQPGWVRVPSVVLGQVDPPVSLVYIGLNNASSSSSGALDYAREFTEPWLFVGGGDDFNMSYYDGPPTFLCTPVSEGP